MYDTKDAVIVEMSLPGVDPKKIELSIENGLLTMKGSSERTTEVDEKDYYHKEIRSGTYVRQMTLPPSVREDSAKASYDNGILRVIFAKQKLPATQKIAINTQTTKNS